MNPRGLIDYTQPLVAAATVLVLGSLICAFVAAATAYRIKVSGDIIEVTGSAKEAVVSDAARWTIHIDTRTSTDDQQSGFDRLDTATKKIVAYLRKQGVETIETPTPNVSPNYYYPDKGESVMTGYTVSRSIVVQSNDVDMISELANNISPLTGSSYNVTTTGLELTFRGLPEERIKLLSGAIKDAKARAEAIAKETGRSVGALRSASGGVVQVLPQGGVDISDYGSYDTQSKNKDVMVTVRASFSIQ